jgi:S-adenosylmethionine:tRNA ribosyltransferase-isomerase
MRLSELDYDLPEELIAQEPLARRDEARLLVLDRKAKSVEHSRFYKLVRHLREGDLIGAEGVGRARRITDGAACEPA